jgi:hypothetical protein
MLLLAHAVFGAYYTPRNDLLAYAVIGVVISQPIMLALMAAFARQRFYYYLLWALLICTYLSFADDLGAEMVSIRSKPGETIVANLALFIVALSILLIIRRFSRWRITDRIGPDSNSAYLGRHYGIHHLMILTAIVALACGLIRSLLMISYHGLPYGSVHEFIFDVGLLLFVAFPAAILPLSILARFSPQYILVLYAALAIVAVDLLGLILLVFTVLYSSRIQFPEYVVLPFLLMQAGTIVSAVGSTLVLRYCGFRVNKQKEVGDATKH